MHIETSGLDQEWLMFRSGRLNVTLARFGTLRQMLAYKKLLDHNSPGYAPWTSEPISFEDLCNMQYFNKEYRKRAEKAYNLDDFKLER